MMLLWSVIRSAVDSLKRSTLNWLSGYNVGSSPPRKRNLETWDEESIPSPKLRRTLSLPAMQREGEIGDVTGDEDGFKNRSLNRSPKLKKKERPDLVFVEEHSSRIGNREREPRPSDSVSGDQSDDDIEVLDVVQKCPCICSQPSVSTLTKIVLAKRSASVGDRKGAIPRPSTSNKYFPPEKKEVKCNEKAKLGEKMEYLHILQKIGPLQRRDPSSCVELPRNKVVASNPEQSCISNLSLFNDAEHKNARKCAVFDCSWAAEVIAAEKAKVQRSCLEGKLKERSKKTKSEEPPSISLEQRLKQQLTIANECDKEKKKSSHSAFTTEMVELVDEAFKSGPGLEVMVQNNGVVITRKDIHTLIDGNWLNDEVVNFYMLLLEERGTGSEYPSVHCFSTFFYPKLSSSGHDSVKRWTSKVDIFDKELLIIPVHLGIHWCLACVDFPSKEVLYFDSMGVKNSKCLKHIVKYLQAESMDKKQRLFDMRGWTAFNKKNIPQQMNGSDCGVFTCMYAEYMSRRAKITFTQVDMPFFRRKIACEILTKRLFQ